jgi:hypothetical protein
MSMNLREKEDVWAAALGGFAAGAIIGLPCTFYHPWPCRNVQNKPSANIIFNIVKKFAPAMAVGAAFSAVQGTFFLFGNRIDSYKHEDDEFERKEILRRTTRVPVEETITLIGEGRGNFLFLTDHSML